MSTKMKGLFKGLRYISHIFEEDKEQDIQIGFPTDVKHVAHIGWDGPSVDNPSWMKEFKGTSGQSAPLASPAEQQNDDPEVKWVSEDSKTRVSKKPNASPGKDSPEVPPRSSRRNHSSESNQSESDKEKDPSAKPRPSRRKHSKDSSEGSTKSNRQHQSQDGNPPDIPKKTRRKKSKETDSAAGSTKSRPKAAAASNGGSCASDTELVASEPSSVSQPGPADASIEEDEEKERRVTTKD